MIQDNRGQIIAHNTDASSHADIRGTITAHTDDTDIHVTVEEKTAWNAKADKSYVDSAIQTAIGNAIGGSY